MSPIFALFVHSIACSACSVFAFRLLQHTKNPPTPLPDAAAFVLLTAAFLNLKWLLELTP